MNQPGLHAMDIEQIETELLFEALKRRYGYDFRDYSPGTARRRVLHRVSMSGLNNISELQHLILRDRNAADALVKSLSINVTEMFRDPAFFLVLRQKIIPALSRNEHFKIWHAGCAGGEEVFSMAILLAEEGGDEKATLYGTDFNRSIIEKAKTGVLPMDQMKQNIHNYQASGGCREFAGYYRARYEGAIINQFVKRNIVFSLHNLVSDAAFGTFQMIVCRNVLIYFNQRLKERVFRLFLDSLQPGGYLCLGSHESLMGNRYREAFEVIDGDMRIYQRAR